MLKTRFLQEMKKLKQSIDIVEQMLIRSPESIPTHIHARFFPNAEAETRVSHDRSAVHFSPVAEQESSRPAFGRNTPGRLLPLALQADRDKNLGEHNQGMSRNGDAPCEAHKNSNSIADDFKRWQVFPLAICRMFPAQLFENDSGALTCGSHRAKYRET